MSTESEVYDLIVIGGGISGLSMAYEAQHEGLRVLLLEKASEAGGCFHSVTADGDDSFWLEMGTHTCFNSYGRLLSMLKRLGMMELMTERTKPRYRMLADNELCSIPSRLSFIELFTHAWRIFKAEKGGKSVSGFYAPIVGSKNYQNVFRHAFSAVLCQQADDVPADMLFRKRPRDKEVMRSYTFAGGLSDITGALEERLDCRTGVEVSGVTYLPEAGFIIEAGGESLRAARLAVATPVQAAARLLKDVFPEIAERLSWIGEVEIESVGIIVRKNDLKLEQVAGIIAADGDFYSSVSRDYLDHSELRGMAFHFKPGLLSDDEKLDRICELLELDREQLVQVIRKTNRLPAPDMGHHALMAEIDDLLDDQPLALIGNYFKGVAVEDCLERVERELARIG